MSFYRRRPKEFRLILFITIIKFLLHLTANSNFGFHRDELLYIALGQHLGWGYMEVPPFIAGVSKLSITLLGDSVFATRLIPSLFSSLIIYLTGLMVLTMGGNRFAVAVACVAMLISPAFLASGYLLQPVVFDQFFWVLSAYLMARVIQKKHVQGMYWLGIAVGAGMLVKYTMVLFIVALVAGMLFTAQRKLLFKSVWFITAGVAFAIFLPNLLWQISHGFPLLKHMAELRETQLENIDPFDFLIQLLLIHASAILVWLPGFIYLFYTANNKPFKFLAYAFVLVIVLLFIMKGKVYYSFGAFPMLFAAGGVAWQKISEKYKLRFKPVLFALIVLPALIFIPVAVPVLSFNSTLKFFDFISTGMSISFPLKWEDQKYHATTQDYADMKGWTEMARLVNTAYKLVPLKDRSATSIIAGNYGMAGAIDHLGKRYNLPGVVCLNSSYALWSPQKINTKYIIYVDDEDIRQFSGFYKTIKKIGEVENPFAREKGTMVHLLSDPIKDINVIYQKERLEKLP